MKREKTGGFRRRRKIMIARSQKGRTLKGRGRESDEVCGKGKRIREAIKERWRKRKVERIFAKLLQDRMTDREMHTKAKEDNEAWM